MGLIKLNDYFYNLNNKTMEKELIKQLAELNDKYLELKAENERLKEENGWLKDLINVIEQINDNSNIDSTIKEFKELITNP